MGYLQKEQRMLQKLADTNYAAFSGNKDRALKFMTRNLSAFPDYVNVVVRMETMGPIWKAQLDGPEYRERMQNIDTERRNTHNNAISSVNAMNRLSEKLELPPFSRVDTNDRHAVAEMISEYITEVYNTGINKESHPDIHKHMNELTQSLEQNNTLEME